jgi:hypothetical protein
LDEPSGELKYAIGSELKKDEWWKGRGILGFHRPGRERPPIDLTRRLHPKYVLLGRLELEVMVQYSELVRMGASVSHYFPFLVLPKGVFSKESQFRMIQRLNHNDVGIILFDPFGSATQDRFMLGSHTAADALKPRWRFPKIPINLYDPHDDVHEIGMRRS